MKVLTMHNLCDTAVAYMGYLKAQRQSKDQWISTCANFLETSYDVFKFVEAYRVKDAIAVEYGYQKQSPVWFTARGSLSRHCCFKIARTTNE